MAGRTGRRAAGLAVLVITAGVAMAATGPQPPAAGSGLNRGVSDVGGTVVLTGTAPAAVPIDMSGDPYCSRVNAAAPAVRQAVAAGDGGRLADVVVYVKEGLAAGSRAASQEAVLLDQQNCVYRPRVVALQTRQPILIRNSDETLHNVHVRAQNNREFNIGQIRGVESRRSFTAAEIGVRVTCDIHGWMSSTIAVFDHPFFAISGTDGTFSIADLPAGEYVLEAWHATLGTRQARVTVPAGGAVQVSFSFEVQ